MSLLEARAVAALAAKLDSPPWDFDQLLSIAPHASQAKGGWRNQELLTADHALNDAYWRALSLVDPLRLPKRKRTFAHLYEEVKNALQQHLNVPVGEAPAAAEPIAGFLKAEAGRLDEREGSAPISSAQREELIGDLGGDIRCWYCGFGFHKEQVAGFVKGEQPRMSRPPYVDFVAPRWRSTDAQIEVDHVAAVSKGGRSESSNLRISCGWCNRHKSALGIIYDAQSRPRCFQHPKLGPMLIPVPFWTVRVRGSRRQCEADVGCHANIGEQELVVGPGRVNGSMVPGNLAVYCRAHDPFGQDRLVARHVVAA